MLLQPITTYCIIVLLFYIVIVGALDGWKDDRTIFC